MSSIEKNVDAGNLEEALEQCLDLLRSNEYDLEGLFFQGIISRKKGDYEKAVNSFNTLINLIPVNPDFYAERGLTYHSMKEHMLADDDFSKAIDLEPKNSYRYASRAFIRDFYKDYQGALKDYDKAIELDPDDAIALNNKGVLEEKLGRLEAAKESYDKSDKISGVDKKLKAAIPETPGKNKSRTPSNPNKMGFGHVLSTIKNLFTSPSERRKFFDFLLRRK